MAAVVCSKSALAPGPPGPPRPGPARTVRAPVGCGDPAGRDPRPGRPAGGCDCPAARRGPVPESAGPDAGPGPGPARRGPSVPAPAAAYPAGPRMARPSAGLAPRAASAATQPSSPPPPRPPKRAGLPGAAHLPRARPSEPAPRWGRAARIDPGAEPTPPWWPRAAGPALRGKRRAELSRGSRGPCPGWRRAPCAPGPPRASRPNGRSPSGGTRGKTRGRSSLLALARGPAARSQRSAGRVLSPGRPGTGDDARSGPARGASKRGPRDRHPGATTPGRAASRPARPHGRNAPTATRNPQPRQPRPPGAAGRGRGPRPGTRTHAASLPAGCGRTTATPLRSPFSSTPRGSLASRSPGTSPRAPAAPAGRRSPGLRATAEEKPRPSRAAAVAADRRSLPTAPPPGSRGLTGLQATRGPTRSARQQFRLRRPVETPGRRAGAGRAGARDGAGRRARERARTSCPAGAPPLAALPLAGSGRAPPHVRARGRALDRGGATAPPLVVATDEREQCWCLSERRARPRPVGPARPLTIAVDDARTPAGRAAPELCGTRVRKGGSRPRVRDRQSGAPRAARASPTPALGSRRRGPVVPATRRRGEVSPAGPGEAARPPAEGERRAEPRVGRGARGGGVGPRHQRDVRFSSSRRQVRVRSPGVG
ncbi:basic proline-rich protein-like [Lepus europaeus]|uniref:basic proline-rich protein-like n=1 Tax=Lepus europaeus TaxID=9983 RepID=UPI002B45BD65|nr:basic proline-rich protein-like [Lepus europaeus]